MWISISNVNSDRPSGDCQIARFHNFSSLFYQREERAFENVFRVKQVTQLEAFCDKMKVEIPGESFLIRKFFAYLFRCCFPASKLFGSLAREALISVLLILCCFF